MTVQDVLARVRDAGIVLQADGDRLIVDAPVGALDDALRALLATRKPELLQVVWRLQAMQRRAPRALAYARAEAQGGPGYCFSCGDALEHAGAYGRCTPCDVAAEIFYAHQQTEDGCLVT